MPISLRRTVGGSTRRFTPAPHVLRLAAPDPRAAVLAQRLAAGDWDGADAIALTLTTPRERDLLADAVEELILPQTAVDAWVAARRTAFAHLIAGCNLQTLAWQARTRATADQVTQAQFERFSALLRQADEHLKEATRLDTVDPTPWARLIRGARGLQLGRAEEGFRLNQCLQRDPTNFTGVVQYLQNILPKWGGTADEALAFSRWVASRVPEGSSCLVLVPQVHAELSGRGRQPLRSERDEILAAAHRCIGSSRFVNDAFGSIAVEWFEIAFSLAGVEMA